MKIQLLLTLLFMLIAVNEARVFGRCELVSILRAKGMDGYHGTSLGDWVCLASHGSDFDSSVEGPRGLEGSREYGIFQINSLWWCSNGEGRTVNGCHTSCHNFLNDDISDDIECAKKIVHDPNWMHAWEPWNKYCKGRDLSRWTEGC